jgi:conjugative relaxase-like TrwC/TraI family protein
MLSMGKLAAGQADYYLDLAHGRVDRGASVASGVEDYYVGGTEPAGRWLGRLGAELGLAGEVGAARLKQILDPPEAGASRRAAKGRVPGFDLTFSAPKSVSVVFGVGGDRLQAEIAGAHGVAVEAALGYLERDALAVRRGHGGRRSLDAAGFVAAAFDHRTSRAGDPQLHTHVLVANRTRGVDGKWSALDGRLLYRHAKTAGFLYQAVLRSELSRRLEVGWTAPARGVSEVEGVPAHVSRAFSRRRVEIEAELERRGVAGRAAGQVAALSTRRAKDYRVAPERLMPEWRARAEELGFGRDELNALFGHARVRDQPSDQGAVFRELAGASGLTAARSTFTRRDVLQRLAERSNPSTDVTVAGLETLADAFLAYDEVVRVTQAGEPRYSVAELVAKERELLGLLADGSDADAGVASEAAVEAALASRPSLAGEQRETVQRLVRGGARVQVVIGRAGTGKTFALDAAREAWEQSGWQVVGAAVARRAARELEEGAGIQATSLAALLRDLRARPAGVLPRGAVVVIDEAGMVPTRAMHELARNVHRASGKLVLVGDPRQLPEIEAGGAFAALAVRGGAIELRENRRQRRGWEQRALESLRGGEAATAIASYRANGEIVVAPNAERVRERLVADWWAGRGAGEALMIAFRRSDVADLNVRARELLRGAGQVRSDEVDVAGAGFAKGDRVVIRRGDRGLGVVNGERGVVAAIVPQARAIKLRLDSGRDVTLEHGFLDVTVAGRPALQHAYAVTGHVAQGLTTDQTFVLGTNQLFREWGYVAMSRGRHSNRMYAVVGEPTARDEIAPPARRSRRPLEDLTGRLERSERQLTTVDEGYAAEYGELGDGRLRAELARLRLSRLTAGRDPELRARVAAAREELHRRAAIGARAAALAPPAHLKVLGEPPDGVSARARWHDAASATESYRLEYGVEHPASPLGVRPENPVQLVAWQRARRELDRQRELGRDVSLV